MRTTASIATPPKQTQHARKQLTVTPQECWAPALMYAHDSPEGKPETALPDVVVPVASYPQQNPSEDFVTPQLWRPPTLIMAQTFPVGRLLTWP